MEENASLAVPEEATVKIELAPLVIPTDGEDSFKIQNVGQNVPLPPPTPVVYALPSLRGKLYREESGIRCRGMWAMSEAQHDIPEFCSEFEFKMSAAPAGVFPVSGKYSGWFKLKKPPPSHGHDKIEERSINMIFTPVEEATDGTTHTVAGQGQNRFGSYTLQGTLNADGSIQMFRQYLAKPEGQLKKRPSISSASPRPSVPSSSSSVLPTTEPTPREGAGRIRKQSSFLLDAAPAPSLPRGGGGSSKAAAGPVASAGTANVAQGPLKSVAKGQGGKPAALPPAPPAPPQQQALSARQESKRLAQVAKCGDLLKELSKLPQAIYFLEPVDPIKLNIPEYTAIVKNPMDFSTIRNNIAKQKYETPEAFAEHMRLVFKNAIAFNQLRDHPVHIAARDMASKFESKFRGLQTQFATAANQAIQNEFDAKASVPRQSSQSSSGGSKKGKTGGQLPKVASGPLKRQSSGGHAAPMHAPVVLPPDGSLLVMQEMQRKMQQMQNEILQLRSAVGKESINRSVAQQQEVQQPLTYQEKKDLIAHIESLSQESMDMVVQIIREAAPQGRADDDDEIEIPLDELDTVTLRKLQRYVEQERGKKRSFSTASAANFASSSSSSSSGEAGEESAHKRRRDAPQRVSSVSSSSSSSASSSGLMMGPGEGSSSSAWGMNVSSTLRQGGHDLDDDVALFTSDSFENENDTSEKPRDEEMVVAEGNGNHALGGAGTTSASAMASATISPQRAHTNNLMSSQLQETTMPPPRAGTSVSVKAVSSPQPLDRRQRSDSIGDDEYDSILAPRGSGDGPASEVTLSNAAAWANTSSSSAMAVTGVGEEGGETSTAFGIWGEAANEMQAKLDREQQLRAEEERLVEARKREEAERIAALQSSVVQQELERERAEALAEQQRRDADRLLLERRKEERRQRETMEQTICVEETEDLLEILGKQ